jgi:hypothetical protein
MTQQQVDDYLRRRAIEDKQMSSLPQGAFSDGYDGQEADLHEYVRQICNERGWLLLTGSMAHKTHRTKGEPDCIVVMPRKVWFVELKNKTGKLSNAQLGVKAHLEKLGHTLYVLRSKEEIDSVIRDLTT